MLPAARVTDTAVCVGPPDVIVMGAFTTLIDACPPRASGTRPRTAESSCSAA
ncbi:hypothetical protein AB5I41_09575 [Sphingomonas sp. MMS24-JH45]